MRAKIHKKKGPYNVVRTFKDYNLYLLQMDLL